MSAVSFEMLSRRSFFPPNLALPQASGVFFSVILSSTLHAISISPFPPVCRRFSVRSSFFWFFPPLPFHSPLRASLFCGPVDLSVNFFLVIFSFSRCVVPLQIFCPPPVSSLILTLAPTLSNPIFSLTVPWNLCGWNFSPPLSSFWSPPPHSHRGVDGSSPSALLGRALGF